MEAITKPFKTQRKSNQTSKRKFLNMINLFERLIDAEINLVDINGNYVRDIKGNVWSVDIVKNNVRQLSRCEIKFNDNGDDF